MPVNTQKYICPACGGQCAKGATVYFTKYDERTGCYEMFANRICKDCAYEWVEYERSIVPVVKDKQNG